MTETANLELKVSQNGINSAKTSLDQLSGSAEKAERASDRLADSTNSTEHSFTGLKVGISATIAVLVAAGLKVVSVASQFQSLQASLEVATGSAKEAAMRFEEIQEFAATTPFSVASATDAFIKLKNYGLDPSTRALTAYGDTASAMGKQLDQMIEAVADATTFQFERLKEFGIKASQEGDKVRFTFRGVTTEVAKDAQSIEDYLIKLGEVNFGGQMARQSETMAGAISNLGDSWDRFFNQVSGSGIGDLIESGVRKATGALDVLSERLKRSRNEIVGALDEVEARSNILGSVFEWNTDWDAAVQEMSDGWRRWSGDATNAELASEGMNRALQKTKELMKDMTDAQASMVVRDLSKVEKELKEEISGINKELKQQQELFNSTSNIYERSSAGNKIAELREELSVANVKLKGLNELFGVARDRLLEVQPASQGAFVPENVDKYASSLLKLRGEVEQDANAINKSKAELYLLNVEQELAEKRALLGTKATKEQTEAFEKQAQAIRESARAVAESMRVKSEEKEIKKEEKDEEKARKDREEFLAAAFETEEILAEMKLAKNQEAEDELAAHFERELEIADAHYTMLLGRASLYGHEMVREYETMFMSIEASQKLSMDEQLLTMTGVLETMTRDGAKHSRKMFELNKAAGISNAIVSTYVGATKALELGPYIGPIMAGLIILNGMAKVQTIRSQTFGGGASAGAGSIGSSAGVTSGGNYASVAQQQRIEERVGGGPVINIYGDIHGNDGRKLFNEFKDIISNSDEVLIEVTSANGIALTGG